MKLSLRDLYPLGIISALAVLCLTFFSTTTKAVAAGSMPTNTVGFFCADNGEFSGMGELHYITNALQQPIVYYSDITECGNVTSGFLNGNNNNQIPALIVTTGISALNAAMCTAAVQQKFQLQKILYIGTSGWSQFVGGMDPSNNCQNGLPRNNPANAIGSVCITNAAASYACGMCKHNNSLIHSSECSRPDCNSRDAAALFGPCTFSSPTTNLQQDLNSIAQKTPLPPMPTELQTLSKTYWLAQGFTAFPSVPSVRSGNCIEMDMQKILASGPADNICREYTADVLNSESPSTITLTANDVSCVNAMEGIGFLRAIYGYNGNNNKKPTKSTVQVAIVRGASNWDTYPIVATNWDNGVRMPGQKWIQMFNYTSEANHGTLTQLGYQYAILTTNTIVLQWVSTLQ